jgi:hypothetical protein
MSAFGGKADIDWKSRDVQRKNKKAPFGGPYNLIALVFSEGSFGQRVVGFGLNSILGAR